jgi:type II secretory pathway pseudopilin PulG
MSFFKYIKSKRTLSRRLIGGKSGFILIGLVLTMIVFAILGAAILPMFSSATLNQVSANLDQKAYYMAESGFRYTASRYLHQFTGEARDDTLTNLTGKTFSLSGQGGSFTIDIESFFYNTSNGTSGTAYKKVPAEIVTTSSGLNGNLAVSDTNTSSNSKYNLRTYTGYTVEADGLSISFTGATSVSNATRIFPSVILSSSAYTGITSMPSSLTLGGTSDLSLFPLNSGSFRIVKSDGFIKYADLYTYKSLNRVTRTFTGVTRIQGTTASVPLVSTDIVLLQRVIRLKSTGTAGDTTSNIFASRPLTYTIPVEALSGSGSGSGFSGGSTGWLDFNVDDSRPFTSTSNLGDYVVDDGALQITAVNSGQQTFFAIYPTANAINPDYELQVKIRVSGQPEAKHMAGLTFRKQSDTINPGNNKKSYGVSFLRGSGDGIPDLGMNGSNEGKTYIALWEAPSGAFPSDPQDLIAYKEITNSTGILKTKDGKQMLADWPTLLVRVREETVSTTVKRNIISVYYANNGTSTIGSNSPTDYTRKGSPKDGLTNSVDATKYLPWPINNIGSWTAAVDYFTVVQWDSVNAAKGELFPDGSYANVIVKTIGETDLDFLQPQFEFGLHAFGKSEYTTKVWFDDFAYRLGSTGGGGGSAGFLPGVVTQ